MVSNNTVRSTRPVVSNIFYFHPYLGKIPILTNIFQMGWNHQLERMFSKKNFRWYFSCHTCDGTPWVFWRRVFWQKCCRGRCPTLLLPVIMAKITLHHTPMRPKLCFVFVEAKSCNPSKYSFCLTFSIDSKRFWTFFGRCLGLHGVLLLDARPRSFVSKCSHDFRCKVGARFFLQT